MQAIEDLLKIHGDGQFRPDIIGFHGQTIPHDPAAGLSLQIGDAELLARHTQIPVVHDFRSVDIAHGGQGAPVLPLYHRARILSSDIREPVAIVNIGGVANVTWIDPTYGDDPYAGILAFDTGPGNALMDDCLLARTGQPYDADGQLASRGQVSQDVLQKLLDQAREYLAQQPPKSLDRDVWDTSVINDLSDADALATLCAFTVEMIARGLDYMPTAPACWYVSGGGRLNAWLMHQLEARLQASVQPVEMLGWNGDATEAEGFAYLAVRSLLDLPLSLPLTSGVNHPVSGGKIFYNI
jgi:anhydro-N-acetylmuramic acid kinase